LISVLFTGGGGVGNEILWHDLKNRYNVFFADVNKDLIHPSIPNNRKYKIPYPKSEFFLFKLKNICIKNNIDLIIPSVDEELLHLSQNLDFFSPIKILIPDVKYINFALDKLKTINTLKNYKINVPHTFKITDSFEKVNFPLIVKPLSGRGSRDIFFVSKNEVKKLSEFLLLKNERYIAQEKVSGIEYTVQMVCDEKKKLAAIVPVKVRLKKGITILAETDYNPYVIEACLKIHNTIPARGCYNIQLILTKNKKVFPFEINPRISTTFCMTIASGIDPIMIFMKGNNEKNLLKSKSKLKLKRFWKNFIIK